MAPRRSGRSAATAAAAAAPAALPLDGDVIALSGTFDDKKHNEIEAFLVSLGASISRSVTKKTTHLVTTQADFSGATSKVVAAQKNDIPIVRLGWAEECEAKGSKVPEDDFAFSSGNSINQSNATQPKQPSQQKTPASATPVAASSTSNGSGQNGAGSRAVKGSQQQQQQQQQQSQTTTTTTKANGSRSKKRTKNASPQSEDEAQTKSKKQKAANGTDKKDEKGDTKTDKAALADGQVANSKSLVIPLDEGAGLLGTVYISPDGVIYDASLNQTNASSNNNKFYRLQLVQNGSTYKTWTRWGRVGESGANATLGDGSLQGALKMFNKKFKDKSGLAWDDRGDDPKPNKYAFIERSYEPDSDDDGDANTDASVKAEDGDSDKEQQPAKCPLEKPVAKCTLEKPVEELMGLIFNLGYFAQAMSSMNYDANKLPLGKLSKNTILRGFQALKDLSALLSDNTLADAKYSMTMTKANEYLSNLYYTLIPHAFGRTRPPIIRSGDVLKKELELLDSLSDMKVATDLMKVERKVFDVHPADRQYQSLGMEEMTALDRKSQEFTMLSDYLNGSKGSTHGISYKVQQIFRIERGGELDRFQNSKFSSINSDRRLLWHGSRVTNFGGILSQGLRIAPPEAPVSGYMFGKGIYLADMSTKSANYCASYNSGGEALLLLCEAELGDPMQKLTNSSYSAGETAKKGGMWSTWGQGNTGPSKWLDAGCVHPSLKGIKMPDTSVTPGKTNVPNTCLIYNEYIVYDVAQVRLRYLFRVKM